MRIAVIQASSQISKNELLFNATKKYATNSQIYNFGCTEYDVEKYSYIEISLLIGLLISSKAVDFVVTGCSSGQGMMLACNSMPEVLCGYAPTPKDAYLFAQINNGNVISLPLGEEYTWTGPENLEQTIERLFSEPFGQGYPKSEQNRKIKDTELLKQIRKTGQVDALEVFNNLDEKIIHKLLSKKDVIDFILKNGRETKILDWIRAQDAV